MADDGDSRFDDGLNLRAYTHAAFELDGVAAAFLHEAAGVVHGVVNGCLVGHEGHVADDEGVFCAARYGFGVMDHVFHCDRQGVFIAEHDHAEGIADEQHVDACFVHELGRRIVVGREHGNLVVVVLLRLQRSDGIFHRAKLLSYDAVMALFDAIWHDSI